ncbi:MAG: hypothetical protein IPP36_00500 [Nitrosomonadales bacterium]|nr:hypothetical protein [Nitrosomonadales bacterium]
MAATNNKTANRRRFLEKTIMFFNLSSYFVNAVIKALTLRKERHGFLDIR